MKLWLLAVGAAATAIPLTAVTASAADTGSPSATVEYEWSIGGGGMSLADCKEALEYDFEYLGAVEGYCFDDDGDQDPAESDWSDMMKAPVRP
ncbi:hypothetical protein [Streptomyces mayonensis]|uniref:hypothetical protein n=1 Tax=Streptomyces mayonensis TaxID=2750816 RepID=UPI001C1E607D|nr:hypothetical protein [Streptomyces sp. A108]MBU6534591.1 hypothetical protein [Streptomyces sp. A108]